MEGSYHQPQSPTVPHVLTLAALVQPGPRRKKQKQPGVWVLQLQGAPGFVPTRPSRLWGGKRWAEEAEGWSSLLLTLKDEELAPVLPKLWEMELQRAVLGGEPGGTYFSVPSGAQADPWRPLPRLWETLLLWARVTPGSWP